MALVSPLVVPRTLDSQNAFLRDEPKHSVNDNCSNEPVILHNGDAKQLISPSTPQQCPGQERLNGTASEQVEDGRRENSNETLFSNRGGSRESSGIVDQEMNGRRKVRWNDSHGNELAEVWEFQPRLMGGVLKTTVIRLTQMMMKKMIHRLVPVSLCSFEIVYQPIARII